MAEEVTARHGTDPDSHVRTNRLAGYAALTGGVLAVFAAVFGLLFTAESSPAGIPAPVIFVPLTFLYSLLLGRGLVCVHATYREQYGRAGRVTVCLLGIAFLVRAIMVSLEPVFSIEITGPAVVVSAYGDIGRFILASVLGVVLLRTTASRLAAGLLALVFPVAFLSAPFLADFLFLYDAAIGLLGLAFVLLGREIFSGTQLPWGDTETAQKSTL